MIELPEATVLAKQIGKIVTGKRIKKVTVAKSPHKFAWYYGDPKEYPGLLVGKAIGTATSYGGFVEISASDTTLLFGDESICDTMKQKRHYLTSINCG